MSPAKIALLPDRGVVHVSGEDAGKFLQGMVTADLSGPAAVQPKMPPVVVYSALLAPQGKILFEFFVVGLGGGLLLETARDRIPDLVKRLTMYKLRAKVTIADASEDFVVAAVWGGRLQAAFNATHYDDPRLTGLGQRWLIPRALQERVIGGQTEAGEAVRVSDAEYHAHRIGLGVPEGGKDYAFGDIFPHDANLDVLNGVSFAKGCFTGQEVVARTRHRGLVRRRILIVEGDGALQTGSEITAGPSTIGSIGSVAGNRALALVRLDRMEEAAAKGELLIAAGNPVGLRLPDYLQAAVATAHSA